MKIQMYGRVQGVGFRPTVYRIAKELACRGYIRNNGSNVEIVVHDHGQELVDRLLAELPPLAKVTRVETSDEDDELESSDEADRGEQDFVILESTNHGKRDSYVPPDIAVCDECYTEMFHSDSRRYLYPFTNCTNCGARYSLIQNVPYDRTRTAMDPFKLCSECQNEYKTPSERRFHAQTISCPDDGPEFSLYDDNNSLINTDDPLKEFSKMLNEGKIGVMKSWGGMHIACNLNQLERLREWYKRPAKPFAVMVRDLKAAERYGLITPEAKKLLISPERPIVLVPKNDDGAVDKKILENISPGLGNIGLYLPYTGIQHILFHHISDDALVMTSANPKGMPMIIKNDEAFKLNLECYLLHDREIVNRIDDSLVIPDSDSTYFIRRARGYIPIPFDVQYSDVILSLGTERNVTVALSKNKQLYPTQYIGNTNYFDVLLFLDSAIEQFRKLFDVKKIDAVAVDLHPQYPTSRKGKALSEELGCDFIEVQHHHAHAASLMLDNKLEPPFVAITIDGAGYGTDGTVWGGEVLKVLPGGEFERMARLEQIPLLGGDKAVKDIKRLRFAVVLKTGVPSVELFPPPTKDIMLKLMDTSPVTSSLGRTMDALSNIIGICENRTYDGEPAMRLEPYLSLAPEVLDKITAETKKVLHKPTIIETTPLFKHLLLDIGRCGGKLTEEDKKVLVTEFIYVVTKEMVECAVETASAEGLTKIGVSGGVAYNLPLVEMLRRHVKSAGMELVTHKQIPCGDGGISIGQNIIANEKMNR
jgi:hydrogenase maturation protein HypF